MAIDIKNNIVRKILPILDVNRIINLIGNNSLSILPKIVEYSLEPNKSFIDFEWVEGSVVDESNLQLAYYKLGQMHKECWIANRELGFTTICHGDFHENNIIENNNGLFFVDVTYLHEDWNYSDLDYLDLFDLFPKEKYPWFIKDTGCFDAYLESIEVKCDEINKTHIKEEITKYTLNKYIQNGLKRGINVDFEMSLMKIFAN